ncbi:SRPBCC family protein [Nocardiopsis sp. CNT312]|uniref:SRPBCC family protein n=1 Tax=Nocardiopsis sp. CNT312 TaxID=1137268 RepID=UPI00048CE6C6|nr:SRPBCC family protein [Nocardiopsis sp. CNT312]
MKIEHEFTVDAPTERVWALFTDVEAIAPCMPGTQLTGVEGDVYSGKVRVKVGPVVAAYEGTARFVERDAHAHRATLEASGKASRGVGNASATVTFQLSEAEDGTRVAVETDLKITGKLAQMGGGMIKDVSEKLLGQFTAALEEKLTAPESGEAPGGGGSAEAETPTAPAESAPSASEAGTPEPVAAAPAAGTVTAPAPAKRTVESAEPAPVDLGAASRDAVLQRLWPVFALLLVGVGIGIGYVLFA